MRCWVSVLVDVVDRYDGAVIAHPAELARDGRDVAPDWLRTGWPATGHSLAELLTGHAAELASVGLLVHWTPPSPGQPPWLPVTALEAPPRVPARLNPASYIPARPPSGGKRRDGWPQRWKEAS